MDENALDAAVQQKLKELVGGKNCQNCGRQAERFIYREEKYKYFCNACKNLEDRSPKFIDLVSTPFEDERVSEQVLWRDFLYQEKKKLAEDGNLDELLGSLRRKRRKRGTKGIKFNFYRRDNKSVATVRSRIKSG